MNASRTRFALVTLAALVACPAAAVADWKEPVGGASPINNSATRNAQDGSTISLTSVGGVPYLVWAEDTTQPPAGSSSQIRVARLAADGQTWEKVGNSGPNPISRLSSTSSKDPDMADIGGVPWVTWSEGFTANNSEIRVARFNPATNSWVRVVDPNRPVNHLRTDPGGQANYPSIADGGAGRPYVSFFEADPGSGSLFFGNSSNPAQVWVDRLNAAGTGWAESGGGPVSDPAFDAAFPRMTTVGGVPWLVYFQLQVPSGQPPQVQIQTAHLSDDGQSWVHIGPIATGSPSGDIDNPTIANIGGRPYVAFGDKLGGSTKQIRVFRLNDAGNGWEVVGGGPASPAGTPDDSTADLTAIQGEPWVAWRTETGGGQQFVARLVGGQWQQVGSPVTPSTISARLGPSIASINGIPWVGYGLTDNTTPGGPGVPQCCTQARVSRLEPTFSNQLLSQAESTKASFLTTANTFGLAYPAGFEYGLGSTFTSATGPVTTSGDPAVIFEQATGLTPSSLYSFRPYATAGTPLPRLTGPSGMFITESPVEAPPTQEPPVIPAVPEPPMLALIVDYRKPLVQGHKLRVDFFVSKDATVDLQILRRGLLVDETTKDVSAGRRQIVWTGDVNGRAAPTGRYKLALIAHNVRGDLARDRGRVRVVAED
jgi:hypothetical protein